MSEQITHLAVADDTRLVALASPRICEELKAALDRRQGAMRLGAVTRGGDRFAPPLIRTLRQRRQTPGPRDEPKLAFCLGVMTHRAADRLAKPLFTAQTADGACERIDIRVYQDVFLFNRLYGRGRREPYRPDALDAAPAMPPAAEADAPAFESYYRVLFQRALLSAHTLKPGEPDADGWLDRLFDALQEFRIDLERYRKALVEPDERLARRAISDVNFYNDEDPILVLLDELRAGRTPEEDEVARRCYVGDRASVYARMVAQAMGYVEVVSAFWTGRADYTLMHDTLRR
jgi:hypothetical protein